jgi:methylated-DNA-[protein]-cysteine S-methyltransferase
MVVIASPIGPLGIDTTAEAVTRILFHATGPVTARVPRGLADDCKRQLDEYFEGRRTRFDLPLAPEGTPFQRGVWTELAKIPYGETTSYGVLARRMGKPAAVRAVGAANGQNPIPIVIPCHRVIGSDGRLVGFGGGLDTKRFLLRLEQGSLFD